MNLETGFRLARRLIRGLLALLPVCVHHPGVAAEARGDAPTLEIRPERTRAYLHEAIPVTVTLLTGSAAIRNIQYPRLEGAAFRAAEFSLPRQTSATRDGHEITVYAFSTSIVPHKSGKLELGPAELQCDLLALAGGATSFFGAGEPRSETIRSTPVSLTILPLPEKGRPAGFTGAVGRFTLVRQANPTKTMPGDPVVVTTRIAGVGKFGAFSCPSIALSGIRAYPPRAQRSKNQLVCEQVLVPEKVARLDIPALRISYFAPLNERYQTLDSGSIRLEVTAPPRAAAAPPPARTSRAEKSGGHAGATYALTAIAAASLLALVILFMRRRRTCQATPDAFTTTRPSVATWLAEAERALHANDPTSFHTAVFRALQEHLGMRYGRHPAAITGEIVTIEPRPAGIEDRRIAACIELFGICDRARYGPAEYGTSGMPETLGLLREATGPD